MSATQGNISGTGTGNTVVATSFINSGAISICCNADGKVSIRSNNGSFTFYTQASESSALSQVGGVFGSLQIITNTFVVLGQADQRVKTTIGTGGTYTVYNLNSGEWYHIKVFTTGSGAQACLAVYRV